VSEHVTHHAAQTHAPGRIWVGCSCGWKDEVDVTDCDFWKGLERIFAARDEHMALETLREATEGIE
jgi:hypothetical protein